MMLKMLLAASVAASTPALSPEPIASMPLLDPWKAEAGCSETPMSLARKSAERPSLRRLNQLPPAQAFAAVDRRVERCPAPMLMSEQQRR